MRHLTSADRPLSYLRRVSLPATDAMIRSSMPPITPDPNKIKSFRTEAAFENWVGRNHARETEVWVRIYKKNSGVPSVTPAEALDVVLCWGWIDGIRKSFDDESFLQRYTPRREK